MTHCFSQTKEKLLLAAKKTQGCESEEKKHTNKKRKIKHKEHTWSHSKKTLSFFCHSFFFVCVPPMICIIHFPQCFAHYFVWDDT